MKYYCRRGRNQVARQQSEKRELFDTVQNIADVTPLLLAFPVNHLNLEKRLSSSKLFGLKFSQIGRTSTLSWKGQQ